MSFDKFCIEAVEEAIARHGRLDIFNTDQGNQFTSPRFSGLLTAAGIQVSMDGWGRWMDKVFIERLWRSMKYEPLSSAAPSLCPVLDKLTVPVSVEANAL